MSLNTQAADAPSNRKIALQIVRRHHEWLAPESYSIPVKESLPYAESERGHYTHRVRSAMLHKLAHWPSHISIHCWCGMSLNVSKRKHGRFVAEPSRGRPICATCEGRAVGAGQDGSHKINGRMVRFSPRHQATAMESAAAELRGRG